MSKIPVNDIKEKADLKDYLEEFYPDIRLRRSGNVHLANCPFHSENTPSFTVFDNGTYKCFGCGEHGDVIGFVSKTEGLNFKESCRMIAENVGVEYTITPPNEYHEEYKNKMDDHTRRYWRELQGSDEGLSYLMEERGLTEETIKEFRLGIVPKNEYTIRKDIGGIAGKLSFPIMEHAHHTTAKCIAMGYRAMDGEMPKYMNDRNQEGRKDKNGNDIQDPNLAGVFIKSNILYGYSLAQSEIRKKGHAVITEGYMDTVSMHQAGIKNTVAIMGTGFTEPQMEALLKITKNIIMFLDSDNAGVNATFKVLPALYEKGFNVMIVSTDNGDDASDVCLRNNFDQQKVRAFIGSNSKPAMNVVIDKATSKYEQIVIKERLKAMNSILPLIDIMPGQAEKDIFKDLAHKRLDITG